MTLYFKDAAEAFNHLVPSYLSKSYGPLHFKLHGYDRHYGEKVYLINPKRARDRITAYRIPEEMARVSERLKRGKKETSIRFGFEKKGKGYHGERGDFCLAAGAIQGKHLFLFYRSLELIGGFSYDLCIINDLQRELGIDWKSVTIYACHANVFALRRNSNEALYPKLRKIFQED